MTRKLVPLALITLIIALAVALLWRPATTRAPVAVEPIAPSRVERIRVTGPEIPAGTATRLAPGEWLITLDATGAAWPASTPAVRSALRALAEIASLEPATNHDAENARAAATLTLEDDAGAERRFDFAPAVIGGRRAVTIDERATVIAPAPLTETLATQGPAAWRDPLAFPGLGPDVARLLIEQAASAAEPARRVELTRAGGRWLITAPVVARAGTKAVDAAIARIAGAEVERFIDEPLEPELTGLDQPVFTITVAAEGEAKTVRFGAEAGASGLERFAAADPDEADQSRAVFVVDTALLTDLRLDPAAYTDRHATPTVAADVAAITVAFQSGPTLRAERTLSGWSVPSKRFDPATLLTLLTSGPGATVAFESPIGWAALARVRLENLAGNPLDELIIGVADDGRLRVASSLPGEEPVYYSIPGLTPEAVGLPPTP